MKIPIKTIMKFKSPAFISAFISKGLDLIRKRDSFYKISADVFKNFYFGYMTGLIQLIMIMTILRTTVLHSNFFIQGLKGRHGRQGTSGHAGPQVSV